LVSVALALLPASSEVSGQHRQQHSEHPLKVHTKVRATYAADTTVQFFLISFFMITPRHIVYVFSVLIRQPPHFFLHFCRAVTELNSATASNFRGCRTPLGLYPPSYFPFCSSDPQHCAASLALEP